MKTTKLVFGILSISLALAGYVHAQNVTNYFSTTNANTWQISGGGATNARPDAPTNYVGSISVISGGDSGTYVAGMTNFTGFWLADYDFYVPYGATNVSLNFANFYVDDRGLLLLNGNPIVATGVPFFGNLNPGSLVYTDGGSPLAYDSFVGPNGSVSGSVTNGFVIGGTNTLRVIINNTHEGVAGSDIPVSSGDGTFLVLSGAVSYSLESLSFLTNGLVAYYPFNGNANDASGNGNNATNVNATLCPDRFGNPKSAYSFNSTTNVIQVPQSSSLDVYAGTGFSVSGWINSTTGVADPIVSWVNYQFYSDLGPHLTLFDAAGQVLWTVGYLGNPFPEVDIATSGGLVPTNTWTQVAGTYNKSNGVLAFMSMDCGSNP